MIDITTVQPFKVPPHIMELQNENLQLLKMNQKLSNQTTYIISAIVIAIILSGLIIYNPKINEDEKTQ